MWKKRYLTIQLVPDHAGKIISFKLGYGVIRFFFYSLIILIPFILIFLFKFSEINLKAFTSENLARKNKSLLENQNKIDSLETELNKIHDK